MNTILQGYKNYLCGRYRKQRTIKNYYEEAKQFLKHLNKNPKNLTKQDIEQYRIHIYQKYSRNTITIKLCSLNHFLEYLEKPELRVKTPPLEITEQPTLTEEEYKKLYECAHIDVETLLIFKLLSLLLRPQEIINLKIQDKQDDILHIRDGKTGSSYIILDPETQKTWDIYTKYAREKPKPQYQDYLFINTSNRCKGEKYTNPQHIRTKIKELGIRAGLNKKITPYMIKRTMITLMMDQYSQYYTGDPKIVQRMARHKDLKTTLRYDQRTDHDIRKYLFSKSYKSILCKNNLPQSLNNRNMGEKESNDSCVFSFSISTFFDVVFETSFLRDGSTCWDVFFSPAISIPSSPSMCELFDPSLTPPYIAGGDMV